MSEISRRAVLRAGAVGAAATAVGGLSAGQAAYAARTDIGVSVYPFPLSAVTLLAGPFLSNAGRTQSYLSFLDADRLLHTFRLNYGISSSAAACGGWESPTTELRGHSMGHVLSALAQAYANTGTTSYKTKGDYLVAQLATCQARATTAGFNTGYLSAYPESFIDRVEARQSVWAPYYTLHKIMAGLLDQHLLTGNAQALTVLTAMASWTKFRNDRLTLTQRQNMLDTEFGGMNEVLTNLYQLTGDPNHLAAAQHFDHAEVFDPLAANTDALNNYHANTQIPKMIGAIREYHATGTTRYLDIARNFWDIVIGHHTYAIGGNSNGEYFKAPDRIASELSDSTCECCNVYNMLKLSRQLFFTNPNRADYMDYYEKALYNQLLGAQNPNSTHGFHSYYIPLRAGGIKTYSNDYDNFTCCHGTGMETNTKYADSIYFFSGDSLYVNLFIASQLNWAAKGITVRQDTTFPEAASSKLTITGSGTFTLKVRVPAWATGATVKVNGTTQTGVTAGSYTSINRVWASGDVVDISLPMALTRESTPDSSTTQAVKYGPIVLAGAYGTTNLTALPTLTPSSLAATSTPLQFTATASTGAVTLFPFYKMHGQRYTVYWNVTTTTPLPQFVAHWKFDETSGTSAADATGNGKTASLAGGATWVAGRTGNAVSLSGTSQYVSAPSGILAGATAFSAATWVRLDTVANWARLFDFGTGTTANMFLVPRSSANTARFAITNSGAGGEQQINAPSALPTGVWTHVAVTIGGGVGILYVNGAEVARNSAMTLTPGSLGSTTQNWIGRSQYSGDPYLDGAVDSFRLYSRALTASEVANLYSTGQ
ncbi:glycoside hydrolase family 127 protein [Catellatospora tritici]|uniref:glycoside hydrolase family 127 protein n=1 Tax=Catellatospora tritici TaxID=2851566 RepID=UPI001C2D3BE9|nr:beta-L-arabinofuranosidase domain-containing protein [Catellatospora tritici]MBV1853216.1 glycoside hydrolase family 127 protein [Catellatospora tritici]